MSAPFRIVKAVIRELDGRAGFDHWWGDIDADIQREIRKALRAAVAAALAEVRREEIQSGEVISRALVERAFEVLNAGPGSAGIARALGLLREALGQ